MNSGRLEAFSDGVIAIIITIMVLDLKVPTGSDFETLKPLIFKFLSYIMSFIYVAIYWNNHHHLFQAIEKVNGKTLWSNLMLLFFLSLIPFTSAWMGENDFDKNPVALYGFNLLMCALSWTVLSKISIQLEGKNSKIGQAMKNQTKEIISTVLYISGIVLSFFFPVISVSLYFIVALMWLIPDKRIEKKLL